MDNVFASLLHLHQRGCSALVMISRWIRKKALSWNAISDFFAALKCREEPMIVHPANILGLSELVCQSWIWTDRASFLSPVFSIFRFSHVQAWILGSPTKYPSFLWFVVLHILSLCFSIDMNLPIGVWQLWCFKWYVSDKCKTDEQELLSRELPDAKVLMPIPGEPLEISTSSRVP